MLLNQLDEGSLATKNLVDPLFLFYFLSVGLLAVTNYLEELLNSGNTRYRATTFFSAIHSRSRPLLQEQRAIAHILGTLDDKIELNRRMNETLEAMARALFKSWFVDFDPVRAKAEGRDPGLPKPLADLFPDRFEDSELGEIPAGWEVRGLDEIATFLERISSTEISTQCWSIAPGNQDCAAP